MNRRTFVMSTAAALVGTSRLARGQATPRPWPATRDWAREGPVPYPDPDVIALTPAFRKYMIRNTTIVRLHTGSLWAEGPAWSGVGGYLVWSDIPNNLQHRWLADDGRVTVLRSPSGNSNGNTFDYEGRQLSCEHGGRRVARYERNGTVSVLAERYDGKHLNSPNDVVVHPDGSVWFTDPTYGIRGNYEGNRAERELKEAVYRLDVKTGRLDKVTDDPGQPNGLCFSPDYTRLFIVDTGSGRDIRVYDVDGPALKNGRRFAQLTDPASGAPSYADGIRADTDGNIWAGTPQGVQVVSPAGETIGVIRLPETCANLCFGGAKRNRLFMTASQSLYAVYLEAIGAHVA